MHKDKDTPSEIILFLCVQVLKKKAMPSSIQKPNFESFSNARYILQFKYDASLVFHNAVIPWCIG